MPEAADDPADVALSEQLLMLGRLARAEQPTNFLRSAIASIGEQLSFRGAWWGLCFDRGPHRLPDVLQAEVIGLPESMTIDWRLLNVDDSFAWAAALRRGEVHRLVSVREELGEAPALVHLANQMGVDRAMAMCLDDTASGQVFFITLYRSAADPPFDGAEAAMFREMVRHIAQLWQFALQDALGRVAADGLARIALAQRDGCVLFAGNEMSEVLYEGWPGWDGLQLPADFLSRLQDLPCTVRVLQTRILVTPQSDHLRLSIEEALTPLTKLSPREWRVAYLYSEGLSYKEIARQLGLSPATVRTYLRQAYLSLGVRSKLELSDSLSRASGR